MAVSADGKSIVSGGGDHLVKLHDAETGKELWRHDLPRELPTTARAVAYWPGDRNLPARIIFTAATHALDNLRLCRWRLESDSDGQEAKNQGEPE